MSEIDDYSSSIRKVKTPSFLNDFMINDMQMPHQPKDRKKQNVSSSKVHLRSHYDFLLKQLKSNLSK